MKLEQRISVFAGVICMFTMFGLISFPSMVELKINAAAGLERGSARRELWIESPFPLEFKIYLFNITNPLEIENGEKPIVQEIGPYFYDEYKEKVDLVDREEDDTVEYNLKTTWRFNPSKSNGLTGDEELVFPDLATLEMMFQSATRKPNMVNKPAEAVSGVYRSLKSVFMNVKARDIMFDGVPINCARNNSQLAAVCKWLEKKSNDRTWSIPVGRGLYKFSLFGHKNGTVSAERWRVSRGLKDPKDVGRVLEWNNQSALGIWSGESCNSYNGTDFTIFHPFLYENEDVVSFFPEVCRSFVARYQNPSEVKGIRTNHYTTDLGDESNIAGQECFCPTPNECFKTAGAMSLWKCTGSPLVVTLPHFYLADPSHSESVSGLNPVQEEHEMFLDLEPLTGSPVRAWKRLQFNTFISPTKMFKPMENFPRALLPLFWVSEGAELNDHLLNQLKSHFGTISIVRWLTWTLFALSIAMIVIAKILEHRRPPKRMRLRELRCAFVVLYLAQNSDNDPNIVI